MKKYIFFLVVSINSISGPIMLKGEVERVVKHPGEGFCRKWKKEEEVFRFYYCCNILSLTLARENTLPLMSLGRQI
jgi:hypothetical protein